MHRTLLASLLTLLAASAADAAISYSGPFDDASFHPSFTATVLVAGDAWNANFVGNASLIFTAIYMQDGIFSGSGPFTRAAVVTADRVDPHAVLFPSELGHVTPMDSFPT